MRTELWLASPEQTGRAGVALGRIARPGDAIGLVGDLGAGKTLLVKGLAEGLGVPPEVRVTSPTFTLVNEYHGGRLSLFHADLYRIERDAELDELGLWEAFDRGGVVAVEWADCFPVLPPDALTLRLEVAGDRERRLSMAANGPRSEALAAGLDTAFASD